LPFSQLSIHRKLCDAHNRVFGSLADMTLLTEVTEAEMPAGRPCLWDRHNSRHASDNKSAQRFAAFSKSSIQLHAHNIRRM